MSLRQVEGHPLDRIDASTFLGTTHRGTISNVMDYGVFVHLPIEVDGLLHRNEIPEGLIFLRGDVLDVRVASLDIENRRISLAYVAGPDSRNMTEKL